MVVSIMVPKICVLIHILKKGMMDKSKSNISECDTSTSHYYSNKFLVCIQSPTGILWSKCESAFLQHWQSQIWCVLFVCTRYTEHRHSGSPTLAVSPSASCHRYNRHHLSLHYLLCCHSMVTITVFVWRTLPVTQSYIASDDCTTMSYELQLIWNEDNVK
jgi:hypothetical protein